MKVLLAIDGSDAAYHAAEFFCRLPHDESLQIEVVSVLNSPDVSTSTSSRAWIDEYMSNLNAAADEAFLRVQNCFEGSASTLTHHKTHGHVGDAIVTRAEEIGASLIVIGAKGHSAVSRLLLGSVSDYVSRHASCSVMTVRLPAEEESKADSLRVSIAYDGSKPAEKAVDKFHEFSWRGVDLEVVNVVQIFPEFPAESVELMQEQVERDRSEAEAVADQIVKRLHGEHLRVHSKVIAGEHVGEAIIRAAHENHSQLIVIGNTGRSLIPRLLLGSVSSYVLRHAPQSVWVVR